MNETMFPVFYLTKKVIFPYCTMKVGVPSSELTDNLKEGDSIITCPLPHVLTMIFPRGRLATVAEIVALEKKETQVYLELKGLSRVRIKKTRRLKKAAFTPIDEEEVSLSLPLWEEVRKKAQELIFLINVEESDKLIVLLNYIVNMHQLTDFVSNYFVMDFPRRYRLFRELMIIKRGEALLEILTQLIDKLNSERSEIGK